MEFNLQFFGGRGGSSHSGGGGGSTKKADENRKGSASNPVKASELTAMNEKRKNFGSKCYACWHKSSQLQSLL